MCSENNECMIGKRAGTLTADPGSPGPPGYPLSPLDPGNPGAPEEHRPILYLVI